MKYLLPIKNKKPLPRAIREKAFAKIKFYLLHHKNSITQLNVKFKGVNDYFFNVIEMYKA